LLFQLHSLLSSQVSAMLAFLQLRV
jgi:hypothetical protein